MKRLLLSAWWILGLTSLTLAGWTPDPWNGMVTVTNQTGEDWAPKIINLGTGSYLIAWYNMTSGKAMYQILDEFGNAMLGQTGEYILPGASWGYGGVNRLLADGEGGAVVVFEDYRTGVKSIHGQRFDQGGQPLWGSTGMPLVVWSSHETPLADAVYDGADGFFIAWGIEAGFNNADLYAQKFTRDGTVLWGPYGLPISIAPQNQGYPQIVGDGSSGMVAVWESGIGTDYFLYAQHLDANGNSLLTFNGVPLQLACGGLAEGVPDGEEGGVFVYTTGGSYWNNMKSIRINGRGQLVWIWDSGVQALHGIADVMKHLADGTIWIESDDNRTGDYASYLYHLDLNGNPLFNPQGVPGGHCMAPASNGVITFKEFATTSALTKVIAKRITSDGSLLWESIMALGGICPGGAPIFEIVSSISSTTSDSNDGAVLTFHDRRTQIQQPFDICNIAAQRVRSNGEIGNPPPPRYYIPGGQIQMGGGLQSLSGGRLQFTLAQPGETKLDLYDLLGRKLTTLQEGYLDAGTHMSCVNAGSLPSGVYLVQLTTPTSRETQKLIIAH